MAGKEQNQQEPDLEKIVRCPNHPRGHYMTYCHNFERACTECTEYTILYKGKEYLKCEVWTDGNKSSSI